MMKRAVVRRRYPLTWLSARRIHGMARTGMLVLVLLGQAITMCGGRGRPSFEMHCLLWCWGRTGRPGRRFIPITPAKGKKRIRRSSGYRVAGACPQVGPLPFKAPPALPICTGGQDAPSPIGSFAWQDIQDVSCQICSDLYMGATSVCCVRASGFGPGWFFPTGRGIQAIRVFGSGAWSGLCRALSRVSGSGFAMSGLPVRRGRTVARAPLALFHRQRLPGLSGPAARSTQEQRCFCERDDFASTCSMRRSTSGQLQKTVLNPVDSGRMRA